MNLKRNYVDIRGEKIFYLENEGKLDKNILFIHGNMYSSSCFIEVIKSLEDYKIFAPDMRGYGNSSYNKKVTSIDDFASDIKEFILKLNINNFTVVSWSLGAGVALELSKDREINNRIKNQVFLAPIGYEPYSVNGADVLTSNFQEYLSNFDFINPQKNLEIFKGLMTFNMGLIEDSFASIGMKGDELKKDNIRILFKTFIYNVNMPGKEEFERNIDSAIKQRNLEEVAKILRNYKYFGGKLNKKSTVLHGYDDRVISYMDGKFLADELGARFEKLNDCGHSVMTDKKDFVVKIIKKFVEE
ncbi:alpha/beta fold hydrolase [Peptoniphilus porci]|uniref:Alpha/beta hydrolase n=1 Tax=Peptoniphilus porci TaxID=2652280 RepID=A0A1U7LZY7_9FIRM|nr:alpha/beta hydrolase [Peptoniphilus porci]OLR64969.1 alpha/beta hydrolase [Peptoniphilus porci]